MTWYSIACSWYHTHTASSANRQINANELRLWTQWLMPDPGPNEFGLVEENIVDVLFTLQYCTLGVAEGNMCDQQIKWISSLLLRIYVTLNRYSKTVCEWRRMHCVVYSFEFNNSVRDMYIRFISQSVQLSPEHYTWIWYICKKNLACIYLRLECGRCRFMHAKMSLFPYVRRSVPHTGL